MNDINYNVTDKTIDTLVAFNVTEEVKGKNQRVHKANKPITVFTLAYFFDDAPACGLVEEELPGGDKRLVVKYEQENMQYLFDALNQRIQSTAAARFKAGEEADKDLSDILNRAKTGGSTYLADLKRFKEAVAAYLLGEGKSEGYVTKLVKKLDVRILEDASSKLQQAVADTLNGWQEKDPEGVAAHSDIFNRMAEALAQDEEWLDDE